MSHAHVDASAPRAGGRPLRRRVSVLAAVLLCVNLPGAVAGVEGVSFWRKHRSTGFIVVEGQRRGYVLHVPESVRGAQSVPLVISLHGAGLWGGAQRDISLWNDLADREGFIVAYPSGMGHASPRVWRMHAANPRHRRDVEFLTRLIDTIVAKHGADPGRVYMNGLSNGGGMTVAFSCSAPRRIAAAGLVGAALLIDWESCRDAPPLPAIIIHGTADSMAPYRGGKTWIAPHPFPDIPAWVARFAERNRCDSAPRDSALSATVARRAYDGCAGGADVLLYTLHGDGHVWPGGGPVPEWFAGPDSRSFDATQSLWEFFRGR